MVLRLIRELVVEMKDLSEMERVAIKEPPEGGEAARLLLEGGGYPLETGADSGTLEATYIAMAWLHR